MLYYEYFTNINLLKYVLGYRYYIRQHKGIKYFKRLMIAKQYHNINGGMFGNLKVNTIFKDNCICNKHLYRFINSEILNENFINKLQLKMNWNIIKTSQDFTSGISNQI